VAAAFSANVRPIIETLRTSGVTSRADLAAALNDRGTHIARGAPAC